MGRIIKFTVLGRPQQRGSKQPTAVYNREGKPVMKNGRLILSAKDMNPKSKDWMQEIRSAAQQHFGDRPLLTGPIELSVVFHFNRPKSHYGTGRNANKLKPSAPYCHAQSPDLAKLIRCAEDALTGQVWVDDKQVFRYRDCERRWTDKQERMQVVIREINDRSRLPPVDDQGRGGSRRDERTDSTEVGQSGVDQDPQDAGNNAAAHSTERPA